MSIPIRIAFDPDLGRHVFVFLVDTRLRNEKDETYRLDEESLNALLMSSDIPSIAAAAGMIGPFSGNPVRAAKLDDGDEKVSYMPSELQGPGKVRRFEKPKVELLLEECRLDPFIRMRKTPSGFWTTEGTRRPRKAPTARFVDSLDFTDIPDMTDDDEHLRFIVEDVRCWVLARNIFSLTMRLAAKARDTEKVLTASGFTRIAAGEHLETDDEGEAHGERLVLPGIDPAAAICSHEEDLYISWELAKDESEKDVADGIIAGLDECLSRKRCHLTRSKGREIADEADPRTLLEAGWSLIKHHPGRYIMCCDHCGRSVLSTTQGGARRFCCNSCRSAWSKNERAVAAN